MTRCDDTRLLLGSYAIGGLEDGETVHVEEHLRTCAGCQAAYGELASLPALLSMVDPGKAVAAGPSPLLEDSVLADFAAQRGVPAEARRKSRRRPAFGGPRWRVALPSGLVGAAATLVILTVAGVFSPQTVRGGEVALTPPSGVGGASAQVRLAGTTAGTEVELEAKLPPLPGGEVYELWFVRGAGRVSAGTFTVDADGRADVRLATAARAGTYERLGITREPDGLDPARNGPSVVVGALAS